MTASDKGRNGSNNNTDAVAVSSRSTSHKMHTALPLITLQSGRWRRPEGVRFDEVPAGVPVAPEVPAPSERSAGGRFTPGATTAQRAGGRATRNLHRLRKTAPYANTEIAKVARQFRRDVRRELARTSGGGEVGYTCDYLLSVAGDALAWAQQLFEQAGRTGDREVAGEALRFAHEFRQALLLVREMCAKDAAAAVTATAAQATTTWARAHARVAWFDAKLVDQAVVDERRSLGEVVVAAADFGFSSHASALVIAELTASGTIWVHETHEQRPTVRPLDVRKVVGDFARIAKRHKIVELVADHFSFGALKDDFADRGIRLVVAPSSQLATSNRYVKARELLERGLVRLPANTALVDQLKGVRCELTAKGHLKVALPRSAGSHGDLVAAFVITVDMLARKVAPT